MMQTMVQMNVALNPRRTSSMPRRVTPPPLPPKCAPNGLDSLEGKRLFDDIFAAQNDDIIHAHSQHTKKRRLSLDSLKTAMRKPALKVKRSVSFAERGTSDTRVIERMEKSLWYSCEDLARMKSTAKLESRQLNLDSMLAPVYGLPSQQHNNSDEHHLPQLATSLRSKEFERQRGLERWSSQTLMLSRCVTIVHAKTEVQLEQISQTILGEKDPQRIADLYKAASTQARSYARVLGIADAAAMEADA